MDTAWQAPSRMCVFTGTIAHSRWHICVVARQRMCMQAGGALVGGLLPRAARGRWPRAGGARTLRAAPTTGSALPFLSLTAVLDSRLRRVKRRSSFAGRRRSCRGNTSTFTAGWDFLYISFSRCRRPYLHQYEPFNILKW